MVTKSFYDRNVFDDTNCDNGNQLAATAHLSPSQPLEIRLMIEDKMGGFCMPREHMDFGWVRRCLQLCELDSAMPNPQFTHPIRATGTAELCIVELDSGTRYLTLSYPWGGTKQIKLTEDTQASYPQRNSLLQLLSELP